MRFNRDLLPLLKERVEKRRVGGNGTYMRGTERVDIFHAEHERFLCKVRGFEFCIDEPPERGGTNQGPNPLAYFLSGAGSCFLMHCARLAITRDLAVDELNATVLGRFDREIGGGFTEFAFDVRFEGRESKENLVKLIDTAEELCYVYNTLSKAATVSINLYLNGERVFF